METEQGSDGLLCSLKGAALPVFLILAREERATQPALSAEAGWGRGTTYLALRRLVQAGLATRDARGGWRLTGDGVAVWEAVLCGYTARATRPAGRGENDEVPVARDEAPLPENDTAIHNAQGITVPENDTAIHSPLATMVPESGTAVPESDAAVPESDTRVPKNSTHAHDDLDLDHDHVVDDHDQSSDREIIKRLRALKSRFGRAAQWLPTVNKALVVAWLDFFDAASPAQMAGFWNPTGLLRSSVEAGEGPPALLGQEQARRACPTCGRSLWDSDGSCLVCAGVVRC